MSSINVRQCKCCRSYSFLYRRATISITSTISTVSTIWTLIYDANLRALSATQKTHCIYVIPSPQPSINLSSQTHDDRKVQNEGFRNMHGLYHLSSSENRAAIILQALLASTNPDYYLSTPSFTPHCYYYNQPIIKGYHQRRTLTRWVGEKGDAAVHSIFT